MATSLDESKAGVPATREHFWNLPNTITILRTGAVPVLLFFPFFDESRLGNQAMAWIFIAAAVTDLIDGWLARRGALVTKIGKLLDPLADKLLVSTALIVLLSVDRIPEFCRIVVDAFHREACRRHSRARRHGLRARHAADRDVPAPRKQAESENYLQVLQ